MNIIGNKIESSKAWRKDFSTKIKDKVEILYNHNSDIKCFICLGYGYITSQNANEMIMVIREHEVIEFKSDKSKEDGMPPLEDCGDDEYLVDEQALVNREHFRLRRMM